MEEEEQAGEGELPWESCDIKHGTWAGQLEVRGAQTEHRHEEVVTLSRQ